VAQSVYGRASTTTATAHYVARLTGRPDELGHFCAFVRCAFGNPFRPAAVDPGWLSNNGGTAVKLAPAIYHQPAFDRLPVLADALEDVGCHDADIFAHCRQPGVHARGCWVVDCLLGKNRTNRPVGGRRDETRSLVGLVDGADPSGFFGAPARSLQ